MKCSPGHYRIPASLMALTIAVPLLSGNQGPVAHSIAPNPRETSTAQPAYPLSQYRIDASRSRFMVKAFAGGFLSAFAHDHNIAIRDFSGIVEVTPGTLAPASLQMTIKSASLAVTDKVSASDRQKIEKSMRDEVLEVAKYPEIVFKSTRIDVSKSGEGQYQAKIWGELTLHGVTRSGLVQAKVTLIENGLKAAGGFPLKQTDYNIKPVSIAGGTIKVKDELKLTFDIVAQS